MKKSLKAFRLAALAILGSFSQSDAADNLISNGDFAGGTTGWSLSLATGNTAAADYASGAAVVSLTETGTTNWGVQLTQKGLHLDAGSSYTVTFDASASVARKINVAMSTDKTWHYQGGGDVSLTTALKTYTVKITPDSTVDAGILQFNLGGTLSDVTIDNVVVTGGSSTVTAGSEMIVNGDYAGGENNWSLSLATGNTATAAYATGAATVTLTKTAITNWGVQLTQGGLVLKAGSTYTVAFDASASVARTINVAMSTDKTWHYQGGSDVTLTTALKSYTVKITPDSTVDAGILQFNLGGTLGSVTLDNVSVKELIVSGGVTLLPDTTTIADAPSTLPGLRVKGRFLYTPTGEKVIFRGVNEMFVWGDKEGATLPEIAKTGANSVRIVWLSTESAAGLDTVVSRAIRNKLIPIVEFHDATGKWDTLPKLVKGWLTAPYLAVIKKHEKYLVVNIGNEVGDASVSAADFVAGYDSSIAKLRRAGVQVPLMIDASTYGQSYAMISQTAKTLLAHDSLRNLLFSVHMWWPIKYNTDKATLEAKIKSAVAHAVAKNIPLVVGEFGEAFTEAGVVAATDSIPYRTILSECQKNEIGWLAWSWGKVSNSPQTDLNMSTDGTFAGLQTWGLDVAVTDVNSIKNTSVIPAYIATGAYTSSIRGSLRSADGFSVRMGNGSVQLTAPVAGQVEWISATGEVAASVKVQAGVNTLKSPATSGLWILRSVGSNHSWKVLVP
ncbi:MAG: hypothetical protein RL318_653 [Fibrobacterota bacterium]|jgi:mannan endo-1,4-beta-mannosidase